MQDRTQSDGRFFLFVRLFMCFLGARVLFLIPFFLPLGLPFWGRAAVRMALCLAVDVLVLGPERSVRASALSRKMGLEEGPMLSWTAMVRNAAVRVLRVSPFLTLCLVPSLLIAYSVFDDSMNFKAMRILKQIGNPVKAALFSSSQRATYDFGCGALLLAAAVFLILAAVRWHRDVPLDYGRTGKAVRAGREGLAAWRKMSLQNLLFGLPGYLLWLTALAVSYRALNTGGFRGLMDFLMTSRKPVAAMLESRELHVYLVLILLLVYLPCWCLRKWNLTRVCAGGKTDEA